MLIARICVKQLIGQSNAPGGGGWGRRGEKRGGAFRNSFNGRLPRSASVYLRSIARLSIAHPYQHARLWTEDVTGEQHVDSRKNGPPKISPVACALLEIPNVRLDSTRATNAINTALIRVSHVACHSNWFWATPRRPRYRSPANFTTTADLSVAA